MHPGDAQQCAASAIANQGHTWREGLRQRVAATSQQGQPSLRMFNLSSDSELGQIGTVSIKPPA